MIELTYKDSYGVERQMQYENFDAFLLALSGCLTIPDYLKVSSLTYKGKALPYQGTIGDLYRSMSNFDLSPYQD